MSYPCSYYRPWRTPHEVQSLHRWLKVDHLVKLLVEARQIDFYQQPERKKILGKLRELNGDRRFEREVRFPQTYLVNVTEGKCADLLDQMREALQHNDSRNSRPAYTQSVKALLELLSSLGKEDFDPEAHNIHDRASFEKKYSTTWEVPQTPIFLKMSPSSNK
ncbi:hypothetical protein TKK_0002147 [Trichogramma kaykai]